jgi:cytochrome c peroxidase
VSRRLLGLGAAAAALAAAVSFPAAAENESAERALAARIELGRRLFYDADLSIDGTMACATCHEQKRAFTDGNRTHPGVHGGPGLRNVQSLANVAAFSPLTWADPAQRTLEQQALTPLAGDDPVEMGMDLSILPSRLKGRPCYPALFAAAFPEANGEVSVETVTAALAAFQRTLVSLDAPYDHRERGDARVMSEEAACGEAAFMALCASCHAGP